MNSKNLCTNCKGAGTSDNVTFKKVMLQLRKLSFRILADPQSAKKSGIIIIVIILFIITLDSVDSKG
jgi:hypothetical protein